MTQPFGAAMEPTPAGIGSMTVALATATGPWFVTVIFQPTGPPAVTVAVVSFLTIERSAAAVTGVVTCAVLFVGSDSSGDTAVAWFVRLPVAAAETVAAIRTVAVAPAGSVPSRQVSTPSARVQLPWLGATVGMAMAAGSRSPTRTLRAPPGPLLWTVMVQVSVPPGGTEVALAVFSTLRSAWAVPAETEPVLLERSGSGVGEMTEAVLLTSPAVALAARVARIVTTRSAPAARVGVVHDPGRPATVQIAPAVAVAVTALNCAGS